MNTTATILRANDVEWTEHDGKDIPVDGGTFVTAKYANGLELYAEARFLHASLPEVSDWVWTDPEDELNIVAYRVHSPSSQAIKAAEGEQS